jgi:hypothetical protein
MIMIDEVHNLLAGTHREQRRFLNVLRYLSNELEASLVCLGSVKPSMPFAGMSSLSEGWTSITCRTGATTPSSRT